MSDVPVLLYAALNARGYIGKDNKLMYKIPEDMRFFMENTARSVIVMGRKTFESLPISGDLLKRPFIVVSRNKACFQSCVPKSSAKYFNYTNFGEVIDYAKNLVSLEEEGNLDNVAVIGGGKIYELSMPYITESYLTLIDDRKEGDVKFPLDLHEKVMREEYLISAVESGGHDIEIWRHERRQFNPYDSPLLWTELGDRSGSSKGDRMIGNKEKCFRLSSVTALHNIAHTPVISVHLNNGLKQDYRFEDSEAADVAYLQMKVMLNHLMQL